LPECRWAYHAWSPAHSGTQRKWTNCGTVQNVWMDCSGNYSAWWANPQKCPQFQLTHIQVFASWILL
jgi:hypothetical protein